MTTTKRSAARWAMLLIAGAALTWGSLAGAREIGQLKTVKGQVSIERGGKALPAAVGVRLEAADILRTGADGAAGITMNDSSLLSIGPNSELSLDTFQFDATTHEGRFDATLNKGSLGVVSGRIAKQSPEAMRVKTPASVLGVRGTRFAVLVES